MGSAIGRPALSKCALDYAKALTNPFSSFSRLPCIPDMIPTPSFKFQTKSRGVFQTGTAGTGYVAMNPFSMAFNSVGLVGAYCDAPIIYTDSNYTGSGAFIWVVAGGLFTTAGLNHTVANSPYAFSDFTNNGWVLRLVAAGLRIRYVGSNFRNQGRAILYKQPGNLAIAHTGVGLSASKMLNDNYTVSRPISRGTEYIYYAPTTADLFSYGTANNFAPSQGSPASGPVYLILVDGGDTTSPQSWEFEAVAYFEVQGQTLSLSPSHSDPSGLGSVISALPNQAPEKPPQSVFGTVVNKATNYLMETATQSASRLATKVIQSTANQYGVGDYVPYLLDPDDLD